jgi:hypothetical protein
MVLLRKASFNFSWDVMHVVYEMRCPVLYVDYDGDDRILVLDMEAYLLCYSIKGFSNKIILVLTKNTLPIHCLQFPHFFTSFSYWQVYSSHTEPKFLLLQENPTTYASSWCQNDTGFCVLSINKQDVHHLDVKTYFFQIAKMVLKIQKELASRSWWERASFCVVETGRNWYGFSYDVMYFSYLK